MHILINSVRILNLMQIRNISTAKANRLPGKKKTLSKVIRLAVMIKMQLSMLTN